MSATLPGAARAEREVPDRITLPACGDRPASTAPAVRIFLGTEPAQFRATRAFLWSIEQVRDPARVYEIHVMSQLGGFERRGWTTGFTNYRFAIPHYAGQVGRAIYCDEDQIFLSDPGRLFDQDLGGAGYLATSDTETSVMLIDCERMARVWSLHDAQHDKKKTILRRTLREKGIRGALDPHWNARDTEYVPGRSHLLHYSTLHTQPWRPFPERFVYRTNRDEALWLGLERGAVLAGFEAFTREHPTSFFRELLRGGCQTTEAAQPAAPSNELREVVLGLVADLEVDSLLEVAGPGGTCGAVAGADARWGVSRELRSGLLPLVCQETPSSEATRGGAGPGGRTATCDGVLVTGGLEAIPPEDMPWVVEALFARAGRLLVAEVPCVAPSRPPRGHPPVGTVMTRSWWVAHFESASLRHPEVHWQLSLRENGAAPFFRAGGRFPRAGAPSVWVLCDDRPGNTTQSIGLAEELGWPYERIDLRFGPTVFVPNPLLGAAAHIVRRASRARLAPPWPDVVIAAGRRTAPVSRWIALRSHGRTRIVHLGRKGANPAEPFDLAVSPAYARLVPHPNRMETAGVLTRIRRAKLEEAALHWKSLFDGHPSPRIAVLVGGPSQHYSFSPQVAEKLARDVAAMAASTGGSVFVTTSRRTGDAATEAIARTLPNAAWFHRWEPGQSADENPLLGYLALADVLVVTGESESMLAEATASGKSVHIYPLPRRRDGLLLRVGAWLIDLVVARAETRPRNNRGTTRPQQGLELFCSRLMAGGYVRPHRDLSGMNETMVRRGLARMFDGTLGTLEPMGYSEIQEVAERVRDLLGTTSGRP